MEKSAFVKAVEYDEWEGVCDKGDSIGMPDWDTVETFIRRLNQTRFSSVMLVIDGDYGMYICGGNDCYLIDALFDSDKALVAVNQQADERTVMMTIGKQAADYPAKYVVCLDQALLAAKHFFLTGDLAAEFEWEKEC